MNAITLLAVIAAIGAAAGSLASAFFVYKAKIKTVRASSEISQAETLWAQMQNLLSITQARLDRTEDQRDRLLEGYQHVGPALQSLDAAVEQMSIQLSLSLQNQRGIISRLPVATKPKAGETS